jgi:hypothetical protein
MAVMGRAVGPSRFVLHLTYATRKPLTWSSPVGIGDALNARDLLLIVTLHTCYGQPIGRRWPVDSDANGPRTIVRYIRNRHIDGYKLLRISRQ